MPAAPTPTERRDGVLDRAAKTLVYFPVEADHAGESSTVPWLLLACCLGLGILVSFQSLVLGIALALGCLYGSALVGYLITRWS